RSSGRHQPELRLFLTRSLMREHPSLGRPSGTFVDPDALPIRPAKADTRYGTPGCRHSRGWV
ncbi:MAG TPA: hypothetical protein PLL43_06180, partial [Accumulibacter sp.]|nr:hypothetical protein [Accumulibacter sp.]